MTNLPPGADPSLAAFAAAFAEVAPVLDAWAHCRVRGDLRRRIEPEDLVQEIGVRACQRRQDFDPARGTFRQWVFGFANNVWLEALRELGRDPLGTRLRRGGDSQLPAVADTVTTISRRIAADEGHRACRARLAELDDDEQRLVAALSFEELSHGEAAALLGIADDTCRKRWQRLRERLRADPLLARLVD